MILSSESTVWKEWLHHFLYHLHVGSTLSCYGPTLYCTFTCFFLDLFTVWHRTEISRRWIKLRIVNRQTRATALLLRWGWGEVSITGTKLDLILLINKTFGIQYLTSPYFSSRMVDLLFIDLRRTELIEHVTEYDLFLFNSEVKNMNSSETSHIT